MPTSNVLRLDELRDRRERRLRRCLALHAADSERLRVVEHLATITALLGCDRAAAVWVDEYGPGLVHPHVVLDLVSDSPRRRFSSESLRAAWNDGIPGKLDMPDLEHPGPIPIHDASRSLCVVALGSDGSRAWFLVADGLSARLPLDSEASVRLMFLAGECAGVLLHRDLAAASGQPPQRFAGWPILRDIEGREDDEATSRRIGGRFLVARVLRAIVDDDFATEAIALARQLQEVGRELAEVPHEEAERRFWDEILRALERSEWGTLAAATVALGRAIEEQQGHLHGAQELYLLAHRAAVVAGAPSEAMESARLLGRLLRNRGEWEEAIRWYQAARALAMAEEDRATEAVIVDGLVHAVRDKGNLPGARELLHEGLVVAKMSDDDYALASIHHSLMTMERLSGRMPLAVAHGWRAVNLHRQEDKRYFVLVSLAACFVKMGELQAAEDSYAIVAERVARPDWRFAALEGLAHTSALRGERPRFEERIARADREGWPQHASKPVHAQILQERALSWRALGEVELARSWFVRARDYAQEHGLNQVYFECEDALESLESREAAPATAFVNAATETAPDDSGVSPAELAEIRGGVGALRRALVPA